MLQRRATALILAVVAFALPAGGFCGTLEQIKKSGEIRLGFRTDAPPMSYVDAGGQPAGYSIELCRRIATAVKDELKLADLKVTFVPLNTEERMEAIVKNKADIECGATTITLSRRKTVDFTAMTFVTGGSLLSLADSGIETVASLAGKSVGVVSGTTSLSSLKAYLAKNLIDAKVVEVADRVEAMKQLNAKQIDAYAGDQIVQIGFLMQATDPSVYKISRDLFSYEPYALVVRLNDAAFRLVADRALAQIYRSGQIEQVFATSFGKVGLRPSAPLVAVYSLGAVPE
jgi:ABC-type amino acid transport substrate-binding protein